MKRTPLTRTPMKRALPKGRAAWIARRDAHLSTHRECALQYLAAVGCDGPLDVHHVTPRGMGGTKHDTSPLVTLCRRHHEYVEMHRAWARSVGLLVRRAA